MQSDEIEQGIKIIMSQTLCTYERAREAYENHDLLDAILCTCDPRELCAICTSWDSLNIKSAID